MAVREGELENKLPQSKLTDVALRVFIFYLTKTKGRVIEENTSLIHKNVYFM